MIVDALSQKSSITLVHICTGYVPLLLDMKIIGISLDYDGIEIIRLLYGSYLKVMELLFS